MSNQEEKEVTSSIKRLEVHLPAITHLFGSAGKKDQNIWNNYTIALAGCLKMDATNFLHVLQSGVGDFASPLATDALCSYATTADCMRWLYKKGRKVYKIGESGKLEDVEEDASILLQKLTFGVELASDSGRTSQPITKKGDVNETK